MVRMDDDDDYDDDNDDDDDDDDDGDDDDDDHDRPRISELGPHFVRACAVETHVKVSEEPLYTEIYRKNATPKNADTHFVQACAVETHVKV